jgi:hypothetical protein
MGVAVYSGQQTREISNFPSSPNERKKLRENEQQKEKI